MATKDTKEWALNTAILIVGKAAEGGYDKQALHFELDALYKKLIELKKDAESDN